MGKYHDETGRTYYWIGRSLVKLKENDEALVAFSRAFRIFDRVLTKNHKYTKWAKTAIAGVFKEMGDNGRFYESYQKSLVDSITHERAGDAHQKQGLLDEGTVNFALAMNIMVFPQLISTILFVLVHQLFLSTEQLLKTLRNIIQVRDRTMEPNLEPLIVFLTSSSAPCRCCGLVL